MTKPLDFQVNALTESLPFVPADVLFPQSQKPLPEHSHFCRDSPHPHLHEYIIRTYVRSVKDFDVSRRGERIPFVVTAIVLIEAERSAIAKLGPALADVPGVAEVYSVTGDFDLVAILRVKDHEEIADIVTSKLSQVPGIVKTHTHVAFKVYSKHDLEAMFSVGLQEAR